MSTPRTKDDIAAAIARDIAAEHPDGAYVNLGIGQPTLVADHLPAGSGVVLHTRTGCSSWAPRRTATRSTPT